MSERARRWISAQVVPSKLGPPVDADTIARPRVLAVIERAVERPVALLVASAGSGKSVALATWVAQARAAGRVVA